MKEGKNGNCRTTPRKDRPIERETQRKDHCFSRCLLGPRRPNGEEEGKKASEKADLISSIILPISNLNEYYGLPIPQIEAHKRAVFNPEEINLLFSNLKRTLYKSGIELLEKRRNILLKTLS